MGTRSKFGPLLLLAAHREGWMLDGSRIYSGWLGRLSQGWVDGANGFVQLIHISHHFKTVS